MAIRHAPRAMIQQEDVHNVLHTFEMTSMGCATKMRHAKSLDGTSFRERSATARSMMTDILLVQIELYVHLCISN